MKVGTLALLELALLFPGSSFFQSYVIRSPGKPPAYVTPQFGDAGANQARGAELVVAVSGGDYSTIQAALDAAQAGDTVTVRGGTYAESLSFPRSGSEIAGFITLRAAPGETVILDPGVDAAAVSVVNRSWIKIDGLNITNSHSLTAGCGIQVRGGGEHLEIRNNRIYGLSGSDAVGIIVLGDSPVPVSGVIVTGNLIHDCEPAPSEALVLNGNVNEFEVAGNTVRDVNNIGIDFIGGESWTGNYGVAREGICRGNTVLRARSNYGGGYAAGIYVDGGRDIVVEANIVRKCDIGIEVGAENFGYDTTAVIVRNNIVSGNEKAGIVFGGYAEALGRVIGCEFSGNTLYLNDTLGDGNGEFAVNWAQNNRVRNNLIWAGEQNLFVNADIGSSGDSFDYNLYFAASGAAAASFFWRGEHYAGFANYRSATGEDTHSIFADPLLGGPGAGDFRLKKDSSAIDAGDGSEPDLLGETDYYGNARFRGGKVDIGAVEAAFPACPGDYDGNGTSDIALFRPSSGLWLVRNLTRVWFGTSTDQAVPRDYSGNGTWDFAIYRPSLGKWMARGVTSAFYGVATDIPVPGDYNGDGADDIALFRPSIGKWLVRGGVQAYYGFAADTLVPGDYNGDGTTDIAVFRPSIGKWLVRGGTQVYYGVATDTVVPGDYDGNGRCDFAVWRENTGVWLVRNGPHVYWGTSGDAVQPADYDGDGTLDFAVFRPSSSRWLIYNGFNYYYGAATDLPVTNP